MAGENKGTVRDLTVKDSFKLSKFLVKWAYMQVKGYHHH